MKKTRFHIRFVTIICTFVALLVASPAQAQSSWGRILSGVLKTGQALTITDEQLAETVHEAGGKLLLN